VEQLIDWLELGISDWELAVYVIGFRRKKPGWSIPDIITSAISHWFIAASL